MLDAALVRVDPENITKLYERKNRMKRQLCFFLLALMICIPQTLLAGYEEGAAASRKGLYKVAFAEFKKAAERGDAKAQYSLGVMFHDGIGTPQNAEMARYWFVKAADQGHPTAKAILKRNAR
jgi:hypothetical protein